jgi:hypothetical protein
MLDVHAEALETSSGPYHEFLLMYQALKLIVNGFVEGKEDPSFYRGFIENALPDGWAIRLIRSGNRRAALDILITMPWERFPRRRICFYVDRDLSDYLDQDCVTAENLYITDNYSIENDIVNSHAFGRVIEEVFGICDINEDEREGICRQFEKNLQIFCEAMTPVMAQILIWRRSGVRAALTNIKPQMMFRFRDGRLEIADNYDMPMSRVNYAAHCVGLLASDDESLRNVEQEFREKSGLSRFVRGKYLLWLFVESAVAVHRAIECYCTRYHRPPRVRVTLGAGNAMTIVGPRAKVPESLKRFIEGNYLAYIRNAEAGA